MPHPSNVVPKIDPITEEQFKATWLQTLNRLCRLHGDAKVALWLGISTRHLSNVKSGTSLPTADKIWNLLAFDRSAHDELDKEFGLRKVDKDAVCSIDPMMLDIIALAHETADHEAPDSDGGQNTTDHELLRKDEARLRRVHRRLGAWVNRIDELRRPTLRSVG